jgi:ferredoxin
MNELYVRVNSKCCGYTLCVDVCPEVFALDDSGFAFARESQVAPELHQKVREASDACPEAAIELGAVPYAEA